jgi:hypothetical protein
MKTLAKKAHGKSGPKDAKAGTIVSGDTAMPRLLGWLEWVRREGRGGPSPSRAASILECTRPMVNQLVRRGILERSVYNEDGYSIVVISQRSIDLVLQCKKATGSWTATQPYSGVVADGIGAKGQKVAPPQKQSVKSLDEVAEREVNVPEDRKLALINKMSPFSRQYTRRTEVCCIHCDRVYRAYEAKIVEARPHPLVASVVPPDYEIRCKYWPVCDGSVVDWMGEDSKGNRLPGWEEYFADRDREIKETKGMTPEQFDEWARRDDERKEREWREKEGKARAKRASKK